MSRRSRAAGFGAAALLCGLLAAAAVSGYGRSVQDRYGPLREVLVATGRVPAGAPLSAAALERDFEVRRIPERFVPPDALTSPTDALGLVPAVALQPGSYLLAGGLAAPRSRRRERSPELAADLAPIELKVTGAGALLASGAAPVGDRVDVVVVSEPGPGGGRGRTRVAARGALLLELREGLPQAAGPSLPGDGAGFTATVAVPRAIALELIGAQNFAREIRLVPAAG